jgi:hypothetical protein
MEQKISCPICKKEYSRSGWFRHKSQNTPRNKCYQQLQSLVSRVSENNVSSSMSPINSFGSAMSRISENTPKVTIDKVYSSSDSEDDSGTDNDIRNNKGGGVTLFSPKQNQELVIRSRTPSVDSRNSSHSSKSTSKQSERKIQIRSRQLEDELDEGIMNYEPCEHLEQQIVHYLELNENESAHSAGNLVLEDRKLYESYVTQQMERITNEKEIDLINKKEIERMYGVTPGQRQITMNEIDSIKDAKSLTRYRDFMKFKVETADFNLKHDDRFNKRFSALSIMKASVDNYRHLQVKAHEKKEEEKSDVKKNIVIVTSNENKKQQFHYILIACISVIVILVAIIIAMLFKK